MSRFSHRGSSRIGRKPCSAPQTKWDGSRTTPVHQIPLKDEFNQPIVPTEIESPALLRRAIPARPATITPSSSRGCISTPPSPRPAGRPGEPWIWVDERTGTLLPLSYRSWTGVVESRQISASPPGILRFSSAGTWPAAESPSPTSKDMTPESRWNVSGKVEINCLGCHNASRLQNPSEWAKQILRQNFRWAATAAAGLGEVGGMASRLGPTWDIFDGPNPDDSEWAVAPFVKYDKTLFDGKHRAFLDLSYKPDDARCLACHATAPVGGEKIRFRRGRPYGGGNQLRRAATATTSATT